MTITLTHPTATRSLVNLIDSEDHRAALTQATEHFTAEYLLLVLTGALADLFDTQGLKASEDSALISALIEAEATDV